MSKIRCIVVEDEPLAARVLRGYIEQVPFLELVGSFKDAILATEYLRDQAPDLIFLDIHLPKLKGMAFLKTLTNPPAVIITTAYHEYAVQGFELNVTDYLLKPFEFERFLVAVNKVKKARNPANKANESVETKDHLFINVQKKKVKLMFADIFYIESQREYIRIVTARGEFLSKMSTHEIEAILPASQFRRVHRSFIISLSKINSYTAEDVEVNGVWIPVGRGYKDAIEKL
jgi:DNA-binding LytR/AlgR family response regulator